MKNLKNGFTIAEMLICLVVAGSLAAMLIPSIIHNRPDKNKAMFRKAYYVAERVASELTMDEDDFPGEGDGAKGFAYYNSSLAAGAAFPARTRANTGKYFCDQFARKISTNSAISCTTRKALPANGTAFAEGAQSFSTNDGVYWFVTPNIICDPDADAGCTMPAAANPACPVSVATAQPYICLYVDVNGPEKPNRMVNAGAEANDIKQADRGYFYVFYNGKVQVPSGQAARYLKSTSVF